MLRAGLGLTIGTILISRSFAGRTEALKAKSTSGPNALNVQDSLINPKEHNRISPGALSVLPGNRFPGIRGGQSPVIPSSEVGSADKQALRHSHESCRGVSSTEAGTPASPRLGAGQPHPADSKRPTPRHSYHPLGSEGERARVLEVSPQLSNLGSSIDVLANGDGVTATETAPQRPASIMPCVAQVVASKVSFLH